ncbi:MAG: hypothetical protein HY934_02240 [Candidatus Firestonebacteria bacterium]|nr:hypothetical protein [Candidatus Firestonebacteria bacterium]
MITNNFKVEPALKNKLANKTIKIFFNGLIIYLLTIVINLPNLSAQEKAQDNIDRIPGTIEKLKTAKGMKKEFIMQALSKYHDPRVVEPLVNIMLYDTSSDFKNVAGPDVRTMAAIEICNLASHVRYIKRKNLSEDIKELEETLKKIAIPALIKVLENSNEKPKSNAAIALYYISGQISMVIPYFEELAQKGSTGIIYAFISYTNEKGERVWDENAKAFCLKAIKYDNDRVKNSAALCLTDTGNKEEKELANNVSINILSNSKDERAREEALFVLERIGDEKSIPVVEKALNDTDNFVKEKAKKILIKLKEKR